MFHFKRLAVNFANMVYTIKTSWVVFRAGWLAKAIHTIFDYLDNNPKNDRQVARAYSNWRVSDGIDGQPQSGRPPRLEALEGHVEQNYKYFGNGNGSGTYFYHPASVTMSRILFQKYLDNNLIDETMARMLTAVVLMRLRPFLELLITHPEQTYGTGHVMSVPYEQYKREYRDPNDYNSTDELYQDYNKLLTHPFVYKLHKIAKEHLSGELSLLLHWGDLIEHDFIRRNWTFVSPQTLLRTATQVHSDLLTVDTRPVLQSIRLVATHLWDIKEESRATTRQVNRLQQVVVTRPEVSS